MNFSCSDLVTGYVYEKVNSSDYVYINIDLQNPSENSLSARTVTADSIDLTSEIYYFYVWGKSSSGTISPRRVDFDSSSSTTGKIELNFPVTTYTFILAATSAEQSDLTASTILDNAISVGFTNADLSYSNIVKFTLSETGLSGYGAVYLNFYLDDTWTDDDVTELLSNYNVKVGIYDNGSLWSGYNEITLYPLSKTESVYSGSWWTNVPSGSFDLILKMTLKSSPYTTYEYKDIIIISPNRTINKNFYIPNIIDSVPEAPSDFKAAWCMDYRFYSQYDSETGTSTSLTESSDLDDYDLNGYGLLLNWTDNSKNEKGFKITLVNVSKIANDTVSASTNVLNVPATITDSYWTELINGYEGNSTVVKVYDKDTYYAADDYIAGSVEKNQDTLILYLPFGNCYIAKIEAVNAAGLSPACYATLDTAFTAGIYDESYGANTAVYSGNAFSGNVINVYKIVYYLSGGTLSYTENYTVNTSSSDFIVKYHSYGEGEFFCPTAENAASGTSTLPALLINGERWTHWTVNSVSGSNLIDVVGGSTVNIDSTYSYQKPNDYTGYTSLYLFARYD